MSLNIPAKFTWKQQAVELQQKNPPVQTTWYTLIDLTGGVKPVLISFEQSNTEAAAKQISIEVTLDGIIGATGAVSHDDSTAKFLQLDPDLNVATSETITLFGRVTAVGIIPVECHSIKVRYRLDDAAGTAQTLTARAYYSKLEPL